MSIKGKLVKRRKGKSQGGPLSPLFSNILPDEPDKKLERASVKYVHYADDFSIYRREESEARRLFEGQASPSYKQGKSGIRRPEDFTILGYGFDRRRPENETEQFQLQVRRV
ncbi:MAG: hypothetical protein LBL33_09545 [Tannerella sp.]|jgi:hypothetical protein|nr:hypothetical protein [Tannerella sp.]